MYTIKNMMEEMEALKGAKVSIFGQPVTLSEDTDKTTVDIIDFLKNLEEYELDVISALTVDIIDFLKNLEEYELTELYDYCYNNEDVISALTVDIIDILKNLEECELTELYDYCYNNETEEDE